MFLFQQLKQVVSTKQTICPIYSNKRIYKRQTWDKQKHQCCPWISSAAPMQSKSKKFLLVTEINNAGNLKKIIFRVQLSNKCCPRKSAACQLQKILISATALILVNTVIVILFVDSWYVWLLKELWCSVLVKGKISVEDPGGGSKHSANLISKRSPCFDTTIFLPWA